MILRIQTLSMDNLEYSVEGNEEYQKKGEGGRDREEKINHLVKRSGEINFVMTRRLQRELKVIKRCFTQKTSDGRLT